MIRCCLLANGNNSIGMGHIMRCVAMAEVMIEKNIEVYFYTKYEQGYKFLIDKGFNTLLYKNILDIEINCEYIIIDSYDVDKNIFDILKQKAKKLVYIDDLNLFDYNVNLVINTGVNAKNMGYNFVSNKKFLLGCEYCILRKEFKQETKKSINKNVKNILITTGGSDKYNMTFEIFKFLKSILSKVDYHIIIGQAFNKENIILNGENDVHLYDSPGNMAQIMNNCDLAISAGGNTLYELCNLGIPTIAFIYADNQLNLVNGLENLNCISNIGYYNKIDYSYFKDIIYKYINDFDFRNSISYNQRNLIDGKGVYRIVENILNLE